MNAAATKGLQHPKHDGHGDADPHELTVNFTRFSSRHQAHKAQDFFVEASAEGAHRARVVQAAFGVNSEREGDLAQEVAIESDGEIIEPPDQEFQQDRVTPEGRWQLVGGEVNGGPLLRRSPLRPSKLFGP